MSFKNRGPSIPLYKNDGKGRDTYISFSNGGFSNYPYSNSYKRDFYQINYKRNHPDLYMRRPIGKYTADGNGRDFFIHQNILSEHSKLTDFSDFPNMLRNETGMNEFRIYRCNTRSKFEKNLINRIFYGKCPGIKDRLMKPKVKFNQKIKSNDLKFSLTNPNFNENEKGKENESINVKKITKNNSETDNRSKNHIANGENKFNLNKKMSKSIHQNKKSQINNTEPIEKDFINSVKSIYLFNQRKNKFKESDLPISF